MIALLAALSAFAIAPQTGAYRPVVGERHPSFVLPAIDDRRPVTNVDFLGKRLLLIQFASW